MPPSEIVCCFDVDNTLLDNDRVQDDLRDHLRGKFGDELCELYWSIFEQLRQELGYADYLGALQRYRLPRMHDPRVLELSSFLIDYPFSERLYPQATEVLARCRRWGCRSSCRTATLFFSRGRWNDPACGKPSKAGC